MTGVSTLTMNWDSRSGRMLVTDAGGRLYNQNSHYVINTAL